MLDTIFVIILGIIQGITEWLPISSTGHLIIVEEFMYFQVSDEFMEMFRVVIQLGSIIAVIVLFFEKLNPFSQKKDAEEKKSTIILWLKVAVASVPAAIIGLLLDDWIDEHFFNPYTVAAMLIFYGVLFIIVENKRKGIRPHITNLSQITFQVALMIGAFQVLALIPGTSRSGATIIGALIIGTARGVAAEFSFFMAIPVMFGASLLKIMSFGLDFTAMEAFLLILGSVVAFVVSLFAIRFLMAFVKRNSFKVFGYYRIVLGIILLMFFGIRAFIA